MSALSFTARARKFHGVLSRQETALSMPLRAAACLALSSLFASPALADPLLTRARAAGQAEGPDYRFDMTYDDGALALTLKIDQSRPEGERVVAISPEPDSLAEEDRRKADILSRRTRGDIWCASLAASIPADAVRQSETAATATYGFTPVPPEDAGQMAAAYPNLRATATIDKTSAQLLEYRMNAPRSFKPMPVARIQRFDMTVTCLPGPDGRTYVATSVIDIAGSAMMRSFNQRETRRIANLTPAGRAVMGSP
jgi:hypothetical protein